MTTKENQQQSPTRRNFLSLCLGVVGSLILPVWSFAKRYWPVRTVEKSTPEFNPNTWRLTVDGLVENSLTLSYQELKALPCIVQKRNLYCIERWTVRNLKWKGVQLQTIIELAKPKQEANFLTIHCTDGIYSESLTLEQASSTDVMLAYALGNKPLAPKHGAPLRFVVPEMWGYKSAKWVQRIEFVNTRHLGYWEKRGYKPDAGPKIFRR